jgi:hypothetical protein
MLPHPPQSGHFRKCSGSLKGGPLTSLPMQLPRGRGSPIFIIAVICTPQKISPRFPEARSDMARGVHPAAPPSWFHIVTVIGAVKRWTSGPRFGSK